MAGDDDSVKRRPFRCCLSLSFPLRKYFSIMCAPFRLLLIFMYVAQPQAFQSGTNNCAASARHGSIPFVPRPVYKAPFRRGGRVSSTIEALSDHLETESTEWAPDLNQFRSITDLDAALCQMSPTHAEAYLQHCWEVYNSTGVRDFLPTVATYASVITSWARSNQRKRAAQRSEELLDELEELSHSYEHLGPTTSCVNAVLNAWSQSRVQGAARRCEKILDRMERLSENRPELRPDTITYNTVLSAMSRERGYERRAEELLLSMETMNRTNCQPDVFSFNTVIRAWAKSREPSSSRRAEAILRHMERRYELNTTEVAPDVATYTTVIDAWAKRSDKQGAERSEGVLNRMERAYQKGNKNARPNAMTYNAIINVWSKSKDPKAGEHAIEVLNFMKKRYLDEGRDDCRPDIITYTSVIDTLAKQSSVDSAKQAERMLEEAEQEYKQKGYTQCKPNVRTYTSVINAIGRSRKNPERAEALLHQMEHLYEMGDEDVQPDVVCYNAAINAWGWSFEEQKGRNAYKLFKLMLERYESGKNPDAKPDIITCNTMLNACVHETAASEEDRAEIMGVVISILEEFQSVAPRYGWPNHVTYGNVLNAIANHMPMNDLRLDLAETTFWQCCEAGQLSTLVVSELRKAVDEERFVELMGPAILSKPGETLRFSMRRLPRQWTRYAPRGGKKSTRTRQSAKRSAPRITQQHVGRSSQ